jgi:hypothetical protein
MKFKEKISCFLQTCLYLQKTFSSMEENNIQDRLVAIRFYFNVFHARVRVRVNLLAKMA